ncbi:MAG: PTS sugar transporter subunit IIC [Synergistaceae bacterium]|nr:PTS sugar transporter subunit IIC [Synergistota bacterium]NLM70336.1 PTS sugar transporter subunit IIC [Synergistaceae bacterium]
MRESTSQIKKNPFGILFRGYLVRVSNGMALGLFASLIIGLILKQAGHLLSLPFLEHLGRVAQVLMGPAIGAGVAHSAGASPLGLFSSIITGAIGAGTFSFESGAVVASVGEPVGALVASLAGAEFSRLVSGRTRVDIVIVPAGTIVAGGLAGVFAGPAIARGLHCLGSVINVATALQPIPMGIAVSVIMGLVLTLPISSAALAISLGLSGLAAGASTTGCCCQMIGFAVAGFRDNGIGGLLSQGLGTSMLQVPNIIRNPWIWLPPTLASALLGPVSTVVFGMVNDSVGAGMGTSGLVGQVSTFEVMGSAAWSGVILLHFLLPAALSLLFAELLGRAGRIRPGDMKL